MSSTNGNEGQVSAQNLSEVERRQVLLEWNATARDYPGGKCLHHLFEAQVSASPDSVALCCGQQTITYADLNQRANRIARCLRRRQVGRNTLVAVFMDRSVDMVASLYGILKAGSAYVPIDPEYPQARISFMLEDANALVVLTQAHLVDRIPTHSDVMIVDAEDDAAVDLTQTNVGSDVREDDLAYVIYTSGSTGKPKGVAIEHRNAMNLVHWAQEVFESEELKCVLFSTSICFDLSVFELFVTLSSGGKLVMAKNALELPSLAAKNEVTLINTVPSAITELLRMDAIPSSVCVINLAGELLKTELVDQIYSLGTVQKVHDLYGPSETTTYSTYILRRPGTPATVGHPIANTQIYILDKKREPVPIGSVGEIYIGGHGVARGYLNRPDLTSERFVPSGFDASPGARLYRTGDLACYQTDGKIELRGRIDHQVKIRGYRIELGEIESVLSRHPSVQEVVVVVLKHGLNDQRVVAYIVARPTQTPTVNELRDFLLEKIPDYMIPSAFVTLDKIPLTPNGKMDRAALPRPGRKRPKLDQSYEPPRDDVERFLTDLWCDILELDQVGIHDRFFELGGTSLQMAEVINRIQDELGEIIYVVTLFEAPSISEYAELLRRDYEPSMARRFGPASISTVGPFSEPEAPQSGTITMATVEEMKTYIPILSRDGARRDVGASKNPPAMFILAPPRSGTTLLRVMLSGHPQLFGGAELQLMGFHTLRERASAFSGKFNLWLEGTIRAVMEIKKCTVDEARAIMLSYEDKDFTTKEFFGVLQEWIKDRTLIDKSPSYALDLESLEKIENDFEEPLYIHLVRHPYAMVQSFVSYHLNQVLFLRDHPYGARELGELVWTISHQTTEGFLDHIPDHRKCRMRFEDLVTQPKQVIQGMCQNFGLEFHPDMVDPYKSQEKKMVDGLYAASMPMGDKKFLKHQRIRPEIASNWKGVQSDDFLSELTWELAQRLGYERPTMGVSSNPPDDAQHKRSRTIQKSVPGKKELKTARRGPTNTATKQVMHQDVLPASCEDIAIIGMAGRFPRAPHLDAFWANLRDGVESVSFYTAEELLGSDVHPNHLDNPNYVRASAPLENADCFDADFFGYRPREAELLDPQHRLLLECAYEALEDAGCDAIRYQGLIGAFCGVARNEYFFHHASTYLDLMHEGALYEALLGSEKDYPATRIAYKLNLKGPCLNVQSACSSSGVAIHLACQSLLTGECDTALAGGARVRVPLKGGYIHYEGGIPSPDGHCRAFDANAKGCIFGNGVGLVVLRRLTDALESGDPIRAVIKGSAINNDGSEKVGFTAPSIKGQFEVIGKALATAGVDPDAIDYIEAHGTGTALGDPIEIAALTKAYREQTKRVGYCSLGSLKTNIGHLDAGAAVAGLIKTVLSLQHEMIPPSLNFERPNPQIDFANSPFVVNAALRPWKRNGKARLAGISSFGLGGTNFHAIVEEAPVLDSSGPARPWQLILVSAKNKTALEASTRNLAAHLRKHPEQNLADVAFTSQVGRREMEHRCCVVCQGRDQAVVDLEKVECNETPTITQKADAGRYPIVFMFPGQGAQYVNMSRELYDQEPTFSAHVDHLSAIVEPLLGVDLRRIIYPIDKTTETSGQALEQTIMAQPALFIVEYALAMMWLEWGIVPDAMIGHSVGEYVAACVAGVLTPDDAIELIVIRARSMQEQPAGSMLAVALRREEIEAFLDDRLSLAACNGPASCVVSGPSDAIQELAKKLTEKEVGVRELHTSHAFHSPMMDGVLGTVVDSVRKKNLVAPQKPYISCVTGTWIRPDEATDPAYWGKQVRNTVEFSKGFRELQDESPRLFIEVGPGRALSTLALQHRRPEINDVVLSSLTHPLENKSDLRSMLEALGQLWVLGAPVRWDRFHQHARRKRVSLPTYPFEKKRYWLSASAPVLKSPQTYVSDEVPNFEAPPQPEIASQLQTRENTVDRKQIILSDLIDVLHELSGVDRSDIDAHATFLEMGFDSLFLTRAHVAFQKKFKVKISFRQLFEETPTLDALASDIDQKLPPEILKPPITQPSSSSGSQDAVETVDRKQSILSDLTDVLHGLSGVDRSNIDAQATFLEMGFDSLFLTRAHVSFQKRFKVKISFRQLFEETPTLDALASDIDQKLPPEDLKPPRSEPPFVSGPQVATAVPPNLLAMQSLPPPPTSAEGGNFVEEMVRQQMGLMNRQLDVVLKERHGGDAMDSKVNEMAQQDLQPRSVQATTVCRGIDPSQLPDAPTGGRNGQVQGFGPFRPVKKGPSTELTEGQKQYIAKLVERYNRRTNGSKKLAQRYRKHLADPRTVAGFRIHWKECVYPIVAERSSGSKIWDVDGNEYVDILMGFGASLLGHSPPFINQVLEEQLKNGVEVGPQSPLAGPVADLFCELTGFERMTFVQTGSEAILGALRAARTVTGRDRIALFAGSYHGRIDCVVVRPTVINGKRHSFPQIPGIPNHMVEDVIVLDYGEKSALEVVRQFSDQLAAVLVEPVQSRNPSLQPREFLHALREVTRECDVPLIFDEIITGFRAHPGGAQAYFDVRADMATYGKSVGGGMPMAALAGSAKFLDVLDGGTWQFGDDSFPESGVTFLGGTFVRHPLGLAASWATLKHLAEQGPSLQIQLNERTSEFAGALNAYFQTDRVPMCIHSFSSLFSIRCHEDFEYSGLLFPLLRERGVHVYEDYPCFLSSAHTDADLDFIIEAIKSSVTELRAVGLVPYVEPTPDESRGNQTTGMDLATRPSSTKIGVAAPSQEVPHRVGGGGLTVRLDDEMDWLSDRKLALEKDLKIKGLEAYSGLESGLDELCSTYICRYFESCGIRFQPGTVLERKEVEKHLDILPTFQKFLDYMLSILAQDGMIKVEENRVHFLTGTVALRDAEVLRLELAEKYSAFAGLFDMLGHCARHYRQALSGEIGPVSVLFPNGSRDLIDRNLKERTVEHRDVRLYELLIRDFILRVAERHPLRILEVGAGSGDMTWRIAPELKGRQAEYHVSDLSSTFVKSLKTQAKERGLDFMQFHVLDISKKSSFQEAFEDGTFDFVLGLDVVHATRDLDETLGNLKSLLSPGGLLCLVETMRVSRATNLIWGLAEGWWYFEDRYRDDLPVVDLDTWERACRNQGFATINALPLLHPQRKACEAGLVLAQQELIGLGTDKSKSDKTVADQLMVLDQAGPRAMELTDAQKEIWLASQVLGPEASCAFNLCLKFDFRENNINASVLHKAVQMLPERHEALRLTCSRDGSTMTFADSMEIPILEIDLAGPSAESFETRLENLCREETTTPFDLTTGPLVRARWVRGPNGRQLLVLTLHHIACDGYSIRTLIHDLSDFYLFVEHGACSRFAPAMQYSEYANWQEQEMRKPEFEEAVEYYKKQFSNPPAFLELPTDRPRPAVKTFRCGELNQTFDESLVMEIKRLSAREGCSVFSTLLATMMVLLHRLSGQTDIVIGVFVAGQSIVGRDDLVGHCVNMHPIRCSVNGPICFSEFLKTVQSRVLDMYDHRNYTFGQLMERMRVKRDASRNALFSVQFNFESAKQTQRFGEMEVPVTSGRRSYHVHELAFDLSEGDGEMEFLSWFNSDLYDKETAARWMSYYKELLRAAIEDSSRSIAELPWLPKKERNMLVEGWNDTAADYPREACLHQLFEAVAARKPNATAVTFEETRLTYRELNERANRLAHRLQVAGVGPDSFVAVYLERSVDMVAAVLAILKAAAAYVPLDPSFPKERLAYMMQDSGSSVLVTHRHMMDELFEHNAQVLFMDETDDRRQTEVVANPSSPVTPENLAYVIYTSGSTGNPKGVKIEHRAVVNFLESMRSQLRFAEKDILLAVTTLSFDIAVLELYLPLISGAEVVLAGRADGLGGKRLIELLETSQTTIMQATPATWRLLVEAGWKGRSKLKILCGGEALPKELAGQLLERGGSLWNMYGPTESTVWSTCYRVTDPHQSILIGKPIANTQCYVLDSDHRPLPVGVPGELYIAGDGVARGYLGQPRLTKEKFIPNPFNGNSGARMYRTGDLVKYRPDGNIEYLGRNDFQVKVRGFRIELGDIESTLRDHPSVKDAVVLAREDLPGDKTLVAYFIAKDETPPSDDLRHFLRGRLPDYMVPSTFMVLPKFPLTPNKKIDRNKLPKPDENRPDLSVDFVAPSTPTEKSLAEIWEKHLRVEGIGIHDNFFDLGGDSMVAMRVVMGAGKIGIWLKPLSIFEHQTIAELAMMVDRPKEDDLEQGELHESVPLTPAQLRFLCERGSDGFNHWNFSTLVQTRRVEPSAVKRALKKVLEHHDALRLRLTHKNGEWTQSVSDMMDDIPFESWDMAEQPRNVQRAQIEKTCARLHASLDLVDGPLLRVAHFSCGPTEPDRLFITLHHFVVDGLSWSVFWEDFESAYEQALAGPTMELPRKTTSFLAWASQLRTFAQSIQVQAMAKPWLDLPWHDIGQLPVDFENVDDANTNESARCHRMMFSPRESARVMSPENGYRPANILLSALAETLAKWTESPAALIEIMGHGRDALPEGVNLSRTVGFMLSYKPLVLGIPASSNSRLVLSSAVEQMGKLPDGFTFDLLRWYSGDHDIREAFKKLPRAQVLFNYRGRQRNVDFAGSRTFDVCKDSQGLAESPRITRYYPLAINVGFEEDQLCLNFVYSSNLHKLDTIKNLAERYRSTLLDMLKPEGHAGRTDVSASTSTL